jgi:hypothetical protein
MLAHQKGRRSHKITQKLPHVLSHQQHQQHQQQHQQQQQHQPHHHHHKEAGGKSRKKSKKIWEKLSIVYFGRVLGSTLGIFGVLDTFPVYRGFTNMGKKEHAKGEMQIHNNAFVYFKATR